MEKYKGKTRGEESTASVSQPDESTASVSQPDESTASVSQPEESTASVSQPEESTASVSQPEDKRELIAAARLAVTASKKTGDILPRYVYKLAGVKDKKIPKNAGDALQEKPPRWWWR